jgi:hypothetical protein
MSPRTQDWVNENAFWFGQDEEMTMAAMGLDKKLQKQYGSDYIGTEDYFKTIDRTIRKRFPEKFGMPEENDEPQAKTSTRAEEATPPRRASSVVAPATRSTPPSRIRLEPRQVTLARRLGVTPEEYAKHVSLIERNA